MPPTRKKQKTSPDFKKPAPRTDKVAVLQENIREKVQQVRKRSPPEPVAAPPAVPKPVNTYAREIFFCKTNVRDVAQEEVATRNYNDKAKEAQIAKSYRYKLYEYYVADPKYRIREPLDKLRWESPYFEYRMQLALAKGLCSEEEYQDYRAQLDSAGVAAECWVDMRKGNLLLEHEDKVVAQVKREFTNWSSKLDKLDQYVMARQRKAEERAAKQAAEVLDALLHRSNVSRNMDPEQIVTMHRESFGDLVKSGRALLSKWLKFDDDNLNRRYQLGPYAVAPVMDDEESLVGITPLDQSVGESLHSDSSEIAQMRSEMAMTQPVEMAGPVGPFYQNTDEIITELEPTQVEPIDEPMPLVAPEQPSAEEGSEFSLLTPGQQEAIVISDSPEPSPSRDVKQEDGFWTEFENVRKYTNMEEFIVGQLRAYYKDKDMLEMKMSHLDIFVRHFFKENLSTFRKNQMPKGIHRLTRSRRREREVAVQLEKTQSTPPVARPPPATQSPPAAVPLEPLLDAPHHQDTPRPLPMRTRRIEYEDSPPLSVTVPPESPDTIPMPDSENFSPTYSSTQVPSFGGPMLSAAAAAPGLTPRPSPQNRSRQQRPSLDSRPSTPAFASESPNNTVMVQSPRKRRDSPRVKFERNMSGYEDDVEVIPNDPIIPIEVNDSVSNSQLDIDAIMEKENGTPQAMAPKLASRVAQLFQRCDNHDATLSQSMSGSGGDPLSQNGQSMGFRTSESPSVRSD